MSILSFNLVVTGTVGIFPRVIYINTDSTNAEITTSGFLNSLAEHGLEKGDMALIYGSDLLTGSLPGSKWYSVSYSGGNWSALAA